MKVTRIKDLQVNQKVLIKGDVEITLAKTSKQMDFLKLKISDATGIAYSNIFSNHPLFDSLSKLSNTIIFGDLECGCTSVSTASGGFNCLEVLSLKECNRDNINGIVDVDKLKSALREHIDGLTNEHYRELVIRLFKRPEIQERFFVSPGSEKSGFSFTAGLLESKVRLIEALKGIHKVYEALDYSCDGKSSKLNIDLLVTAAFFSNLGNVKSLMFDGKRFVKTPEGELIPVERISHKILIEELVNSNLSENEKLLLEHIATSTMGGIFGGDDAYPRTKEAFVFSLISYLDRKLADMEFVERGQGDADFGQLFGKTLCLMQEL